MAVSVNVMVSPSTIALTVQAMVSVLGMADRIVIVKLTSILPVVGAMVGGLSGLGDEDRAWLNPDKLSPNTKTQTKNILDRLMFTFWFIWKVGNREPLSWDGINRNLRFRSQQLHTIY